MPAPGTCAICSRSDIQSLDARCLGGESVASVARSARIGVSSLHIHWTRCRSKGAKLKSAAAAETRPNEPSPVPAPESLQPPPAPKPVAADDPNAPVVEAINEARGVHKALLKAYVAAYQEKDYRLMALLVVQLRRNLAQLVEWAGKLARREDDVYKPERDAVLARLFDDSRHVLDTDFPGASEALARAWGTRID